MAITRKIRSRYAGTCKKCRKPYRPGDWIYWTKGERLQLHANCADSDADSKPNPNLLKQDGLVLFEETWGELKTAFLNVIDGNPEKVFKAKGNRDHPSLLRGFDRQEFVGCTLADMRDWLANGFHTDAFANVGERIEARPRRRIKYSEEGELQYDLMRSGFDYPFLEWEKRPNKPGLKIDIDMVFEAGVTSKVIADYSRWLAKTLYSLETEGYDLEVGLRYDGQAVGPNYKKSAVRIKVKDANEASDFNSWSALFSPGGFRMLGFTAIVQSADHQGIVADSSLGYGLNMNVHNFDLKFDPDTRTLHVICPYSPDTFNEAEMDKKLAEVLTTN